MRNMEIHSYVCVCLHQLFTTLVFLLKPSLQFSILLNPLFYVLVYFIIALFSKLHLGYAGFWDVLKKITFSFPSLVEGQSLPFTCLTNYIGQSACTGQETCSNHLSDLLTHQFTIPKFFIFYNMLGSVAIYILNNKTKFCFTKSCVLK